MAQIAAVLINRRGTFSASAAHTITGPAVPGSRMTMQRRRGNFTEQLAVNPINLGLYDLLIPGSWPELRRQKSTAVRKFRARRRKRQGARWQQNSHHPELGKAAASNPLFQAHQQHPRVRQSMPGSYDAIRGYHGGHLVRTNLSQLN